ncbi:MAG: crossover junction endodeoxyribonuclease RuvC [Oscillospiraceae bacterium]|nr:crossover junction endodeoxyribonuclease RuvC [Oscillospiraceae bacterium]
MRILGIDPGYAIVGYGVLEYEKNKFYPLEFGAVTTEPHTDFQHRLMEVYEGVDDVIKRTKPDALAIEKLFFTTNQKTVIQVAQARGVILLAAAQNGIPVYEYTPLQIKQSVTGYGKAIKTQVQDMTKRILRLEKVPKPDDTADRLAVAICHGYSYRSKLFTQIGKTL